jgi:hypothetical protein
MKKGQNKWRGSEEHGAILPVLSLSLLILYSISTANARGVIPIPVKFKGNMWQDRGWSSVSLSAFLLVYYNSLGVLGL